MAYINYMAIDARCIVKEAQLMGSALDRLARNTDLRYDELCNRTAVKQIKDALGAKKIKDKGARQGAKHLITVLEAIYPASTMKIDEPQPVYEKLEVLNEASVANALEDKAEAVIGGENV